VGITVNLKRRVKEHTKTKRFEQGITSVEVLAECNTYAEAEALEEIFIRRYDTFTSGLNVTRTGKGKNDTDKFNTYGYIYSDTSKQKMRDSHWSKRGGKPWNRGRQNVYSEQTKLQWSGKRSGKCWGKRIIDPDTAKDILNAYNQNTIVFNCEFLKTLVKKTQVPIIHELTLDDLIGSNGKPLSKIVLYSHYFSKKYGVTPTTIRNIITGKTKLAMGHDEQISN
jgi:hypothetical protein